MSLTTNGRPSLKMMAEKSGLSIKTISDIINRDKSHLYRESTVQKVMEMARDLNYRPNRAAQLMRSPRNSMIGFLTWNFNRYTGEISNYSVYPFLIGLSHRLLEENYHLGLMELEEIDDPDSPEIPKILQEHFYDAFVVQHAHVTPQAEWLKRSGVPIVWWDNGNFRPENCLQRNEMEVGRIITRNLVELGHKRIAFHWPERLWRVYERRGSEATAPEAKPEQSKTQLLPGMHFSFVDRYMGYLAGMNEAGLQPERIVEGASTNVDGEIRSKKLTALILGAGSSLAWLNRPATENCLRVPEDISLAGCDIEARQPAAYMPFTGGMTYDRYDAGRAAGDMLMRLVTKGETKVPSQQLLGSFQTGNSIRKL